MVFEIKQNVEKKLQDVTKRINNLSALARSLVEQRGKLEDAIKLVEDAGKKVDPALRRKLAAIEKEYSEVALKSVRAELANKMLKKSASSLKSPPDKSDAPIAKAKEPAPKKSRSFLRSGPNPTRKEDLKLATDLGEGLIAEVRRLQIMLVEREQSLKALRAEKAKLEIDAERNDLLICSLDDTNLRLLEGNRALEITNEAMKVHIKELHKTEDGLRNHISCLLHDKDLMATEIERWTTQNSTLLQDLKSEQSHYENEAAYLRKDLLMRKNDLKTLRENVEVIRDQLEENHDLSGETVTFENGDRVLE